MSEATRIKTIREQKGWTQLRMAEHLGLNRSRVSAMENGQKESGPVKRLLDQLEEDLRLAPSSKETVA